MGPGNSGTLGTPDLIRFRDERSEPARHRDDEPRHLDHASQVRLIVVTADLVSARIGNTVEVDSDILSAPRTAVSGSASRVWQLTRRQCLHHRHFPSLDQVVGVVESRFEEWASGNQILHRLCAITECVLYIDCSRIRTRNRGKRYHRRALCSRPDRRQQREIRETAPSRAS